jgi:hypothetical protein
MCRLHQYIHSLLRAHRIETRDSSQDSESPVDRVQGRETEQYLNQGITIIISHNNICIFFNIYYYNAVNSMVPLISYYK